MVKDTKTETALIEMPAMNLPSPTEIGDKIHASFKGIYEKLEQQIKDADQDVTTKVGREKIASLAYKIARTKTGLDDAAADLTADQKSIIDVVNKERREMREELDGLRDKARKPLNVWEAGEAERVSELKAALEFLQDLGRVDPMISPDVIASELIVLKTNYLGHAWSEYQEEATTAYETALEKFTSDLEASQTRIADEAELEELRALKADQDEKEAAEKADAERVEQERLAEERRKSETERLEREAKERAERESKEALDAANQRTKDAKAEAERQAAATIKEAADKVERKRKEAEDQAERERLAEEERAADLKHRKKINNAALTAILKASEVSDAQGKMIIQAISKGQVPHISIKY